MKITIHNIPVIFRTVIIQQANKFIIIITIINPISRHLTVTDNKLLLETNTKTIYTHYVKYLLKI